MAHLLDKKDRQILDLAQRDFPLASRPYALIAQSVAIGEDEVIGRLGRLKAVAVVREICAVFDSARLGYHSTLAAMAVEHDRLEHVGKILSSHACVSHNYERTPWKAKGKRQKAEGKRQKAKGGTRKTIVANPANPYNLWFTVTAPGDCSIEAEIENLAHDAGISDFLILPAIRRFKIGVDFDLGTRDDAEPSDTTRSDGADGSGRSDASDRSDGSDRSGTPENRLAIPLGPREKDAVRVLQRDLPLESKPFVHKAAAASMSEDELIQLARQFLADGVMRRFGAILNHRQAGYEANAMICWAIEPNRLEQAGHKAAAERAVSHCYQRPSFPPRWPYNLMTMVHGRSRDEVIAVVERLRNALEPNDHAVLFSGREFKKRRVRYFE